MKVSANIFAVLLAILQLRLTHGAVVTPSMEISHFELPGVAARVTPDDGLTTGAIVPCRLVDTVGGVCAEPGLGSLAEGPVFCQWRICDRGYVCGEEAGNGQDPAWCEVKEVSGGYVCSRPLDLLIQGGQDICACVEAPAGGRACAYYGDTPP